MDQEEIPKTNNNKCRTCLQPSTNLLALTKLAIDGHINQMSYAELLKEVAHINVKGDNNMEMPQYICGCCSRKLKSSHAFIKQAQEINEQLWTLLKNGDKDCLQESEIDILTCLEIKMENDEEDECMGASVEMSQMVFKKEDLNEVLVKETEVQVDKAKKINDTSTLTFDDIGFESKSSAKGKLDFSASDDSDEEDLPLNDLKEKKTDRKNKVLQKEINDEEAVSCLKCNKMFNNSKELNRHLRNTHVPEDQKCACPICGAKFSRPCNMYTHMRTLHDPESVNDLLPPKEIKERTHQCHKCPSKFAQKKHLNYHIRNKHNQENEDGKQSALEDQPQEKKTNVVVRPLCSICGGSFSNKALLVVHMRRHTGEKPFKCDLCDKAYARISDLTCHRRLHTGEKPFKCKICEKTFRVSTKLNAHMKSHTDDRPYQCSECEKSFKYSKDLNIHRRLHTGERPYCCTICGSTFTQSNSLKTHRQKTGHI